MASLPNSDAARDIRYHIHPQTNLRLHEKVGPSIMVRGEGARVTDADGNTCLDAVAGLWCAALGYSEPRLAEAAIRQFEALPYFQTFAHRSHPLAIELAEMLIERAPVPMSKVLFQSSGSEAVDTALKMVWYYHNAIGKPEKRKIISRHKAYHGTTVAAASLTGLPHMHADFNLPIEGVLHTDCPHHYRFAETGESEEEFADRLAANLEALILEEGPETIGAFIAEPVMGTGGVIVPPATYFAKVQPILKRYDILFIVDEVICGFGRTGNMWGSQTFALEPDMITCAKALSGAYLPISALLISEPIYQAMLDEADKIGLFGHGYTYAAHPVCAAVAIEALKIYDERDLFGHARRLSEPFQTGLRKLGDHPLVGEVRGVGLMAAVELVADKDSKQPFDITARVGLSVGREAEARGLIIRPLGDVLVFAPPLIIEQADVDELLATLEVSLDVTWDAMDSPVLASAE